jgi:hypothetical protein
MPKKNHFAEKIAALNTKPAKAEKAVAAKQEATAKLAVQRGKDKAADFVRLAEKRHFAVIEKIRLVGNLSDTTNYVSTADQIAMIFDSIQEELNAARARFKVADRKQKRGPLKLVA